MVGISIFASYKTVDSIFSASPSSGNLLLLRFENDFFYRTDRYFTNGISVDYYNEKFKNVRLNNLLKTKSFGRQRYALLFRQNMYTPKNLGSDSIENKDRPYAGYFTVTYRYESYNSRKRYYAELSGGILGQYSGTEVTQEFVHQFGTNSIPQGWQHQLSNAAIINLQYGVEYTGLRKRYIEITGGSHIRLGTLNTNIGFDSKIRVGLINQMFEVNGPLLPFSNTRKLQINFVLQPAAKIVVYDATLQGGIGRMNPGVYSLKENQIERFIYSLKAGLNISFNNYAIDFATQIRTSSFIGGLPHKWGLITISRRF